jgi:hypothetical protein
MCAYHPPKHLVCEPNGKTDAVGLNATPAIGKVPEEEQDPLLYAPDLNDGQAKRLPSRPSDRSLEENRRYDWQPRSYAARESLIEDG